jgi:hypothetical protein
VRRDISILTRLAALMAACVADGGQGWADNLPDGDVAGELVVLNDNGAWSWFEDERAVIDPAAGKLIVSSVAHSRGAGRADRHGDVELVELDLGSRQATHPFTLSTLSGTKVADDHNSAALLVRPDGRYLAVYSQHNADARTRRRASTRAGDSSHWTPERVFDNGAGTTYCNLHLLPADGGRIYDFTRTGDLDPHRLASLDMGDTWTAAGRLLSWPKPVGDPKFTGRDGSRPYLKYANNGVDAVHFIASDDHPRAYDNSIYHGVIRNGKAYDSFGRVVDGDISDDDAKQPRDYTTVFDTDASPLGHAWPTDLALDDRGLPYAVFTARADNDNTSDHRFLYARFDGTKWSVHAVAKAGGYLYAAEPDYTGLAALDPSDPNRLFISTNIDPETEAALAHYELFEGHTADGGGTWHWRRITSNSRVDNLRPIVPKWKAGNTALLWMRGEYSQFTNFDTQIVGLVTVAGAPANGRDARDAGADTGAAGTRLGGRSIERTRLASAAASRGHGYNCRLGPVDRRPRAALNNLRLIQDLNVDPRRFGGLPRGDSPTIAGRVTLP